MTQAYCPHCGKSLESLEKAAFCPFCGQAIAKEASAAAKEPEALSALLAQISSVTDPKKKHALLLEAEKEYPDSLAVAQELLFLGRLYERGGRNVDFSIIKCYLFMLYLHPSQLSPARQAELRTEFFAHPQLEKCLALTDDQDAFLRKYLTRLAGEFIQLFLRGDSYYMRRFFGFSLDSRAPKLLAAPAAQMLMGMRRDTELTPEQRDLLMLAFYQAFSQDMSGDTQWLNQELRKEGIGIPGVIL